MKRFFTFLTVLHGVVAAVWFFGVATALATGLPQTGQAECFDATGNPVDCVGTGQDGEYQAGSCGANRYMDNGDGTVTDSCTGLMWIKTPDTDGDLDVDTDDGMLFCDALTHCEALDLAGHSDWRLPNVFELESIVDYGSVLPAIDTAFFDVDPGAPTGNLYWSSSRLHTGQSAAVVHFAAGAVTAQNVSSIDEPFPRYVRAVRSTSGGAGAGGGAVVQAGEGGGAFGGNGDVNGDGSLDLSDAIYTLTYLFQGGPPPVDFPVAPGGGDCVETNCNDNVDDDEDGATDCDDFDCIVAANCLTGELPTTGRTTCWDDRSVGVGEALMIPCADTGACPGQDGFYQNGCDGDGGPRFVANFGNNGPDDAGVPVDDTVRDNCTGLEWTRALVDVTGDGVLDASDAGTNWATALATCDSISFAGKSDWRLPNARELLSISTFNPTGTGPAGGSTIEAIFDNIEIGVENFHWSSTTTAATSRNTVYGMATARQAKMPETFNKDGVTQTPPMVIRAVRGGQTNN